MKGLRKYLTPFAPDQSGAASVLYDLGGILVICDAGGCAGNICGFDEPRWSTQRSAVFSAGLRDMDAILGRDDRLIQKLTDVSRRIDANFAAVIGTPVPAVIGTDFQALCRMAARRLDMPVFCVASNGMELYDRGVKNGVPGLKLLSREEAKEMEPHLSDLTQGALYAETAGIICPFRLNIAMAESANVNGVDFFFNTKAEKLCRDEDGIWHISTCNVEYKAKAVVNAAGVFADYFHNMVSAKKIHITPRRGDYFLLDKTTGGFVKHTIFPQPTKLGKGILVAPTIHGNTLVGPTAIDIEDKEAVATTQEGFDEILKKSSMYVTNAPVRQVITSFAGLRAHEDNHEFILGEPEDAPFFFDCAGIESPGLTSSPAIGEYMGEMISSKFGFEKKENWIAGRKDVLKPSELSLEERNELIKKEPAYGRIICRCESITEGEILDAIHRPLGARSLDGVKRRTRAGMGRCQAGFCSPRVMEILQRELNIPLEEVRKNDAGSYLVLEKTKGGKA